ncbi:MAG TPA: acyl-CoA thioesterase [Pyrinomonadaceae bacterium]|nr:acyl-CoA thioesterase [Pyrinomonadaceae bacterium]
MIGLFADHHRFEEQVGIELTVRPNDLDSLGHVNNAVVLEYLETGRWEWLARNGLPSTGSIVPVVARIEIDYRLEIRPPKVEIGTTLENAAALLGSAADRYQCIFRQVVTRQRDNQSLTAVEARVQVAFIDTIDRRIRNLQDYLAQPREKDI